MLELCGSELDEAFEASANTVQCRPINDLGKFDMWPGYSGSFIPSHADVGDNAVPHRKALLGLFGAVPYWAFDTKITRHAYNARSETVAVKPAFRDAGWHAQHCIIPVDAFFEPDWRSGRAIPIRIARVDDEPMGIAGLWSLGKSPQGEFVHSYSMLTVNADDHPLMRLFHKSTDEMRMAVILPTDRYDHWLDARPEQSMDLLRSCRAPFLDAAPASATH